MPRGGRRAGKPRTAYANRTDLTERKVETPPTVPGQEYGVAKQQQQAQKVAPLAQTQAPPAGRPSPGPQQMGPQPVPLHSPTQRPNEPLTAGSPLGAGPGPEVLPQPGAQPDALGLFLKELYRAEPDEDVRALILQHEQRGGATAPRQAPQMAPPGPTQMPPARGAPNTGEPPQMASAPPPMDEQIA